MKPSKRPSKDEFLLKERQKIESEVFDRKTLLVLAKIIKKGIIKSVDFPISTGKEANVFRATTPNGSFVAIKVYKVETAAFFRKTEYLDGDPRFEKIKGTDRNIVLAFARKEFKNLQICEKVGVHAPKPLFMLEHVLVMTFLGENGDAYPTMNAITAIREEDLDILLGDIKKMYNVRFVHADISEYNVLLGDSPYIIDFGQGVVTAHPKAHVFLERDVRNILNYFEKQGIKRDFDKTMKWIKEK